MLVIGSHLSGKTSLIHSLVDQQARLSDDMTDTAVGIDAYEMSFDYDVEEGKPGECNAGNFACLFFSFFFFPPLLSQRDILR